MRTGLAAAPPPNSPGASPSEVGQVAEARAAADQGAKRRTSSSPEIQRLPTGGISRRCLGLRAELASAAGSQGEAWYFARQVLDRVRSDNIDSAMDRFALAKPISWSATYCGKAATVPEQDPPGRRGSLPGPRKSRKRPARWRSAARCCAELVSVPKECGSHRSWRRWDTASRSAIVRECEQQEQGADYDQCQRQGHHCRNFKEL